MSLSECTPKRSRIRPTVCATALHTDLRHVLLTALLTRIDLGPRGLTFRLRWRPPGTTDVAEPTIGHRCEQQR